MSFLGDIECDGDESPRTELRNGRKEAAGRGDAKNVGQHDATADGKHA